MDVGEAICMDVESGQESLRGTELPLDERDIPDAALNDRDSATLTILQLQHCLKCRAASTKGKKADLVPQ